MLGGDLHAEHLTEHRGDRTAASQFDATHYCPHGGKKGARQVEYVQGCAQIFAAFSERSNLAKRIGKGQGERLQQREACRELDKPARG